MKIGTYRDSPRRLMRGILLALTLTLGMMLGHYGWVDRALQARTWFPAWPSSDLPVLAINMPYEGYYQVLQQREQALQTGVYIGDENDFQVAEITHNGQVYPVRLRLQEGSTNQLGEQDKWNWEVRLRGEGDLMGMRFFHLLDPAENNWLNQYAFTKALEREGILTSRYQFVRLYFNGADLGIYAMQEGMTVNLPLRQGLPPGVIIEFDSRPLWEGVRHFGGNETAALADPVTSLNATELIYFQVDTFRIAAGANNADLNEQAQAAVSLLQGLQTGQIPAGEVFDVAKYGRFLALSDLWGAIDGTSLVNLRYYFNPFTYRLEPIGYHSNPLADERRIALDSTYNSLPLQTAYVQAAAQFAQPAYVSQLQADLEAELLPLLAALQRENAQLSLPWGALQQRQLLLQRSLTPTQPLFATLNTGNRASEGFIEVEVANVTTLAVELVGFQINKTIFLPANRGWLVNPRVELLVPQDEQLVLAPNVAQGGGSIIRYVRFQIPLTAVRAADPTAEFLTTPTVRIGSRLVGLTGEPQWTTAVPSLP